MVGRYHVIDTNSGEVVHESNRHPYLVVKGRAKGPTKRVYAKDGFTSAWALDVASAALLVLLALAVCFGLGL